MGFGLPAAIGAQIANPDSLVVDIAGDGSIQMNIQELATIAQEDLPIKVLILNNGYLGMVRQWQEFFYNKRYSGVDLRKRSGGNQKEDKYNYIPDFVKLAEAYNAVGMRIDKKADVDGAIQEALKTKKAVIMDFIINPEENVTPMVPAGAPLHKMISSKEDAENYLLA